MRFPAGLVPVAFAYLLLAVLPAPANARVFQKPLPYPVNALEPVISGESLDAHYRLHARYVERTNELIHGTILDKLPLQAIVLTAPYKSELYNNSLQAYNHNAQWYMLAPIYGGGGGEPEGDLKADIDKTFGGLEGLKKAMVEESCRVFASGYIALIRRTCDKALEVVATGDADNPLRLGQGVPILTIDLWEHAYLLDVGIHRAAYILNFFKIVNWSQVQKLYEGDLSLLLS